MPRVLAFAIDLIVVLVFVLIGRSAHDEVNALVGVAATAAPFVIALMLGWAVDVLAGRNPARVIDGVGIWLSTWIVGLLLRSLIFGGGTAPAFVIVAGVSLGVGLVGWRAVRAVVTRQSGQQPQQ